MFAKEKMKKWSNQLKVFKEPTKVCKICFKEFHINSWRLLFNKNASICENCSKLFQPTFVHFQINNVKGVSIYGYDENIKSYLYQLKGCYDIELADIFLENFVRELGLFYKGFYIVYVPSYSQDDKKREFNHVKEIFKKLNLKELDILEKTEKYKQSQRNAEERKDLLNKIDLKSKISLKQKNILLVDDVTTTGSTLKRCIELISQLNPKSMRVLVMSKSIKEILA